MSKILEKIIVEKLTIKRKKCCYCYTMRNMFWYFIIVGIEYKLD